MDLRELKDEAAASFGRGKFGKAASLYAKLAELDPENPQHLIKQGDSLRREGQQDKAVEAYALAAERLTKAGQLLKAIAAHKMVLEIEPTHAGTQKQLEALSRKRLAVPTVVVAPPARPKSKPEPAKPADGPSRGAQVEALDFEGSEPAREEPKARPDFELPPPPPASASAPETPPLDQPLELDMGPPEITIPPPPPEPAAEPESIDLGLMSPAPAETPRKVTATTPEEQRILATAEKAAERELTPVGSVLTEMVHSQDGFIDVQDIGLTPLPDDTLDPDGVHQERVPLFSDLPHEAFVQLLHESFMRHALPGESIVREGDPGQSFFVLVRGAANVTKRRGDQQVVLGTLEEGAFFGEISLLNGEPRMASVFATEESDLIEISQMLLRKVANAYPAVSRTVVHFYKERLLANVLALSPLFRELDPRDRPGLLQKFVLKDVAEGQVVLAEGQRPDGLYVVMSGACLVTRIADDKTVHPLALLREADVFGEMSLLTRKPVMATVTAKRQTILLMLPRKDFDEVISVYPVVLETVSELNDTRLAMDEQLMSQGSRGGVLLV